MALQLKKLEEKYSEEKIERIKDLENPFRKKLQQKTVLGEALKAGAILAGEAIDRRIKQSTVKKQLEI